MSLNRGKIEDTEGVREAEFVVLDFIRSTPNASMPEIARLIDDVGADVNYIANQLGINPAVARQAYDESIVNAPPIQQVIDRQANSNPIVPPQAPLSNVITVGPGSSDATDVPAPPEAQIRENAVADEPTPAAASGGRLPVGLASAEQAARSGSQEALDYLRTAYGISREDLERGTSAASRALSGGIGQARGDIRGGFGRAESMFSPYGLAGQQALQQQLALSGALGDEAFKQAYRESPQMQFLREEGERGILRTAAARGGLGGGNVMKKIARYSTGLASQDLQNQIANLQALSGQGLTAAGGAAGYAAGGAQELAGLAQQLGIREADLQQALGAAQANIALGLGTRASDIAQTTGTNIAGMRTRAGELLAGQYGTAASQLADLQQAQGAGTANMLGAQTNYINQLQQAAAAGDAAAQTELAQMQANINLGIGSSLAGVPAAQLFPVPNAAGSILQGAALGYQLGEGFGTPSTARQTYPISDMTRMTGTSPTGYQAYNPFQISASNLGTF